MIKHETLFIYLLSTILFSIPFCLDTKREKKVKAVEVIPFILSMHEYKIQLSHIGNCGQADSY